MRSGALQYAVTLAAIAAALAVGLLVPALAVPAGIALVAGYVWYCILYWKARPHA